MSITRLLLNPKTRQQEWRIIEILAFRRGKHGWQGKHSQGWMHLTQQDMFVLQSQMELFT